MDNQVPPKASVYPQSAEGLLKQYEQDLRRLTNTREGLDRAIFRTHAKIEAARELIGLPLAPRRGRPRRDAAVTVERQPEPNDPGQPRPRAGA